VLGLAEPADQLLDVQPETAVRHGPEAPQVEIPFHGLAAQPLLVDAFGERLQIVVPLAAPGLIAVAIFTLISAWNNYLFSFAFTTKRTLMVVPAALLGFIGSWGENYGGLNAGDQRSGIRDQNDNRP